MRRTTADAYDIYRSTTAGAETFLISVGSDEYYFDNDVVNGETYFYKVKPKIDALVGPFSPEASATPGTGAVPAAPTGLVATPSPYGVMLYLPPQNPASILIGYEIYRGDSTGAQETLAIDVVEDLDFDGTIFDTDSTIEVDVNYFYTVKLLNMYGLSAASNEASSFGSPTGDVPDAVTDLTATGGAGKVTLDWSSPTYQGTANLLYYDVQRNDTDGTWDTLDSFLVAKVGDAQFVDESGIPGVEYDYRVLAANEYGDGFTPSNVASGTATGATSAPSAPQNLEVQSGTGYIVLNWDAPTSSGTPAFTAYSIFRSTSSGSFGTTPLASVAAGTLTYNDTSAVAGTPYFYVVKAIGSGGDSPASNQVTATASGSTGTAPSAPQSLSAGGHDGYVILTWQAPSSAGSSAITRYDVFRGTTAGSIGYDGDRQRGRWRPDV